MVTRPPDRVAIRVANWAGGTPAETTRALVTNGPDGLLVVAHDGSVAFANQSARRLGGRDDVPLVGRRIDDVVPPSVIGAWWAMPAVAARGSDAPRRSFIRFLDPVGVV
jgi:PAS domain-containing protein